VAAADSALGRDQVYLHHVHFLPRDVEVLRLAPEGGHFLEAGLSYEVPQSYLSRDLSPSTLKVQVAAIAANHEPVLGAFLGRHLLVSCFLHSARQMRPY
ncbi:hypothetical protein QTP70_016592, partial [Hemibagrus guttatus]